MTHSTALISALSAKYGIQETDVIGIAVAVLKDLHRVAVQGEQGPMTALYECKWLLDEEGQYHLVGVVAELMREEAPDYYRGLIEDVFRYVSPERDLRNEGLKRWVNEKQSSRAVNDSD